ncbi:MAG TPA: hypothetical protein VKB76_10075, partial [Ktedonobacterales bacterium]|nr:hypothetical protein [Ktedonobacterales bacterium]
MLQLLPGVGGGDRRRDTRKIIVGRRSDLPPCGQFGATIRAGGEVALYKVTFLSAEELRGIP